MTTDDAAETSEPEKARGVGGVRRQLRLNTLPAARRSLAILIREFYRDPVADVGRFRAVVYALSLLINGFRVELELDVEAELDEIQRKLERMVHP